MIRAKKIAPKTCFFCDQTLARHQKKTRRCPAAFWDRKVKWLDWTFTDKALKNISQKNIDMVAEETGVYL